MNYEKYDSAAWSEGTREILRDSWLNKILGFVALWIIVCGAAAQPILNPTPLSARMLETNRTAQDWRYSIGIVGTNAGMITNDSYVASGSVIKSVTNIVGDAKVFTLSAPSLASTSIVNDAFLSLSNEMWTDVTTIGQYVTDYTFSSEVAPGANITVTTNFSGSKRVFTVIGQTGGGVGTVTNEVRVAAGTGVTVDTNQVGTNRIYTINAGGTGDTNLGSPVLLLPSSATNGAPLGKTLKPAGSLSYWTNGQYLVLSNPPIDSLTGVTRSASTMSQVMRWGGGDTNLLYLSSGSGIVNNIFYISYPGGATPPPQTDYLYRSNLNLRVYCDAGSITRTAPPANNLYFDVPITVLLNDLFRNRSNSFGIQRSTRWLDVQDTFDPTNQFGTFGFSLKTPIPFTNGIFVCLWDTKSNMTVNQGWSTVSYDLNANPPNTRLRSYLSSGVFVTNAIPFLPTNVGPGSLVGLIASCMRPTFGADWGIFEGVWRLRDTVSGAIQWSSSGGEDLFQAQNEMQMFPEGFCGYDYGLPHVATWTDTLKYSPVGLHAEAYRWFGPDAPCWTNTVCGELTIQTNIIYTNGFLANLLSIYYAPPGFTNTGKAVTTGGTTTAILDRSGQVPYNTLATNDSVATNGFLVLNNNGTRRWENTFNYSDQGILSVGTPVHYPRFVTPHITNAELPFLMFLAASYNGQNEAVFGGGSTAGNAATLIRFVVGSNTIAGSGTEAMRIDSTREITASGTLTASNLTATGTNTAGCLQSSGYLTTAGSNILGTAGKFTGIATNAPNAMLHINAAGITNPALRISSSNSENLVVVTTNGYVGIGTNNPQVGLHCFNEAMVNNRVTITAPGVTAPVAAWTNSNGPLIVGFGMDPKTDFTVCVANDTATVRGSFSTRKSRGSLAAPTAVVSNDMIGSFTPTGYDGSTFQAGSLFVSYCDGPVSSGYVPARLGFVTGSNSSDRVERFVVKANGNVGIWTNTPQSALHVAGNIRTDGALTFWSRNSDKAPSLTTNIYLAHIYAMTNTASNAAKIYFLGGDGWESIATPHSECAPASLYDQPPGAENVLESRNRYTGRTDFLNLTRLAKLVERLAERDTELGAMEKEARTILVQETAEERQQREGRSLETWDWDQVQAQMKATADLEIAACDEAQAALEREADSEAVLLGVDRASIYVEELKRPPEYVPVKKPAFLEAKSAK